MAGKPIGRSKEIEPMAGFGVSLRLMHPSTAYPLPWLFSATLLSMILVGTSCRKPQGQAREQVGGKQPAAEAATVASSEAAVRSKFRSDVRRLYNNRNFAELEALAAKLRDGKERFADGEWKILEFYDSQDCADDEPEAMWRLHDKIHQEWEEKYPESITARVSRARFLTNYAWQARGSGYANTVTAEGWRFFHERLEQARVILDRSKNLKPSCPVLYSSMMKIALGQGWERADFDALFKEAKAFEPEYQKYDCLRAYFLLPRWHGEPGEWETVAEGEIGRQGATGHAIYARVVTQMDEYHDNIFQESNASWRKVRKGFDDLLATYPDSKKLLNTYCRMACLAGDASQAKKLFERIGDDKVPGIWYKGEFQNGKKWAFAEK